MIQEDVKIAINAYLNLLDGHISHDVTSYLKYWLMATEDLQPHMKRHLRSAISFEYRVEGTATVLKITVRHATRGTREVASNQHPSYAKSVIAVLIKKFTEQLITGAIAFNDGYCWGRNN